MMKSQFVSVCNKPEEKSIDMHTHTSASDGFGTPEDLLIAAKEKGLMAVGVTDHDALESAKWCFGYMRHLAESADKKGILMIPGVEVSSWVDLEGETHIVHILGLGIDPYDSELEALCGRLRESHRAQLRRRLEHARELGLGLNQEAEARVFSRGYWGKAEIARELVLSARFECVHDAYCALWSSDGPHVDLDQYVHAEAAISAIHGARGLAILAHPLRREPNGGQISVLEAKRRLDALVEQGLDGIEAYYSSFSLGQCEELDRLAHRCRLIVSCGSDHHDFARRFRLGKTCSDGKNYGSRTNILDALGLGSSISKTSLG